MVEEEESPLLNDRKGEKEMVGGMREEEEKVDTYVGWTADGLPLGRASVVGEPVARSQWNSSLFACLGRNDEFCSSDLEVREGAYHGEIRNEDNSFYTYGWGLSVKVREPSNTTISTACPELRNFPLKTSFHYRVRGMKSKVLPRTQKRGRLSALWLNFESPKDVDCSA